MLLLQASMRTFIFVDGDYENVMIKTSMFEEVCVFFFFFSFFMEVLEERSHVLKV